MKQTSLKYRFNSIDKEVWCFHNRCMWCGKNQWDCLHHIISPSSRGHKPGKFNASLLNSSPMHNRGCHIDNGELHHRDVEIKLLEKTMTVFSYEGYKMTELDKEFTDTYRESHFKYFKNML